MEKIHKKREKDVNETPKSEDVKIRERNKERREQERKKEGEGKDKEENAFKEPDYGHKIDIKI